MKHNVRYRYHSSIPPQSSGFINPDPDRGQPDRGKKPKSRQSALLPVADTQLIRSSLYTQIRREIV